MISIQNIKTIARQKSKPASVSSSAWANAMNWNIEAWKCHLNGQKWAHDFVICCPEQYLMLLDKKGRFILSNPELIQFNDNVANREWAKRLVIQIADMQARGEWNEALIWSKLFTQITRFQRPTPNENKLAKTKKVIKGHRLIRIKSAA
jgi:hypothetical protein